MLCLYMERRVRAVWKEHARRMFFSSRHAARGREQASEHQHAQYAHRRHVARVYPLAVRPLIPSTTCTHVQSGKIHDTLCVYILLILS